MLNIALISKPNQGSCQLAGTFIISYCNILLFTSHCKKWFKTSLMKMIHVIQMKDIHNCLGKKTSVVTTHILTSIASVEKLSSVFPSPRSLHAVT